MATLTAPYLRTDPAPYLEAEIKRFILESPDNCLKDIDGSPIFDEPLVGFSDGDDKLFQDYKSIIGEHHFTPREALQEAARAVGTDVAQPRQASVISYVLPFARGVRIAQRRMKNGPSLHWNNARWHGQALNDALAKHLVALLQQNGHRAVAPDLAAFFKVTEGPDGSRRSNWSHRHAAYAAGLGTFSLNDAFITPRGIAMRCNSVVTDLKLPPSPRPYANHVANCPFMANGSCGVCIKRCVSGAITAKGHDKAKCYRTLNVGQAAWLKKPGYIGRYAGCGLCQTKVPCEDRIPPM